MSKGIVKAGKKAFYPGGDPQDHLPTQWSWFSIQLWLEGWHEAKCDYEAEEQERADAAHYADQEWQRYADGCPWRNWADGSIDWGCTVNGKCEESNCAPWHFKGDN